MIWVWCILLFLVVLPIIQLALDYRLKYVNKDGRTTEHKINRQWLFWVTVSVGLLTSISGGVKERNAAAERKVAAEDRKVSGEKLTDLKAKLEDQSRATAAESAALNSNFNAKTSILNSNLTDLKQRYDSIVSAIATNPNVAASTRSQVIAADEQFRVISVDLADLSSWVEDLDQRAVALDRRASFEKLRGEEAAKRSWEDAQEVYKFIIQRFESLLKDIANRKQEHVTSNFKGIPQTVADVQLGEYRIGTNPNWAFDVSLKRPSAQYLSISVKNSPSISLDVRAETRSVGVFVHPFPVDYPEITESTYKTNVDRAFRDFFAQTAKLEKMGK